jgi:hypothetical protein
VGHKVRQSKVCNKRREENHFGIEDKEISKVTILEIREEVNWTNGYKVTNVNERTTGQGNWER